MAGPEGNRAPGSVVEVSDAQAQDLVTGGYATYLEEPKTQEEEPVAEPEDKPRRKRK